VRPLLTGEDTGGRFALLETVETRGREPPGRIHTREDLAVYVLEGLVRFCTDGAWRECSAGACVLLPRGTEHTFAVRSERARLLVLLAPAGLEGYYRELDEHAGAATAGMTDFERLVTVAARYGVAIAVPAGGAGRSKGRTRMGWASTRATSEDTEADVGAPTITREQRRSGDEQEVTTVATSVRRNEVASDALAYSAPGARRDGQYSLAQILGIWALAALPMGTLSWVVFPRVTPDFAADPLGAGATRLALLTLGLVWSCALSLLIVRREEGDLRWATVRRRLRLTAPRAPRTGARRPRLLWWAVPFLVAVALVDILGPRITAAWVSIFPFLAEPPGYNLAAIFKSRELLAQLEGAWWFLGLFVVQAAFNTILGEELLFRGVLLPRMEGVFGRWSWAANGVLFGLYHLHQPWGIPKSILNGLLYALPASRYRSTWLSIITHSAQSVYLAFLILGVVLGLA
jgi:membrane protease YdiL (CAAX protease family)/quercetin dioxygenase-like cupin family protein